MDSIKDGLRQAMRGLASGVGIITGTDAAGLRHAMAATSVTSLSFDPPSMLVCVNRNASFYPLIADQRDFCINILGNIHADVAANCAMKDQGEDRFVGGRWVSGPDGVPYLEDAQAAIFCRQANRVAHGTHDIVIGDVLDVKTSDDFDPMVFAGGKYWRLQAS
ncbi:MAG: flavin reductase family protein [Sphingobium sp.]